MCLTTDRVPLEGLADTLLSPSCEPSKLLYFTLADVAKHDKPDDCWLVVKGKVYDVSGWGSSHPGGSVVYTHSGRDATDVFSAFHASTSWKWLQPLQVGFVSEQTTPLLEDFRRLRSEMQSAGLFDSSKPYYFMKSVSNLALCGLSLAMLYFSTSYLSIIAAAVLMALFWQQCGWLAHDVLHHQLFKKRSYNDAAGLFFGNVCQGFSVAWWKDKHNLHHAAPNEIDDAANPVDSDIDTLPLLAWSVDMLATLSPQQRRIVRLQHWLIFPVLLVARVSWCVQSILFPLSGKASMKEGGLELATLALHYAWLLSASLTLLTPVKALLFVTLSEFVCGIFLGFVFIQSHNGMEVFSDKRNFVRSQLASTRNVVGGWFNDWFTGGLNRQIEHHLFPTLPRHNLHKAQKLVVALCSKHGLFYENCSMSEATARVLLRLVEIARAA